MAINNKNNNTSQKKEEEPLRLGVSDFSGKLADHVQDVAIKNLDKLIGQKLTEKVEMGGGGNIEQLLSDLVQSVGGQTKPLPVKQEKSSGILDALFGMGGVSQDPQTGQITKGNIGILPALLAGFGGKSGHAVQGETITSLQKQTGTEPISNKDMLKMQVDAIKDLQKSSQEGLLKPNDIFTKYENVARPFMDIKDSISRVRASGENPSAAGDLALIFNYMKILDPGSTVREGEFANAQNSAAVGERVRAIYNRVVSGERLSDVQRGDFLDRAERLYSKIEKRMVQTTEDFRQLAIKNKINPSGVIRDVVGGGTGNSVSEGQTATNPNTGEKVIFRGGQWQPM